jgi:hypothetical protein
MILMIIIYAIFKENSPSKYDTIPYGDIDIQYSVKKKNDISSKCFDMLIVQLFPNVLYEKVIATM